MTIIVLEHVGNYKVEGVGCASVGWGGCADYGCYKSGGHCINYGRRPKNKCRCVRRGTNEKWVVILLFWFMF